MCKASSRHTGGGKVQPVRRPGEGDGSWSRFHQRVEARTRTFVGVTLTSLTRLPSRMAVLHSSV
eukprot:5638015-Prymnesium_polylepis.1